ncbi:MAG: hypothetical protein ACTSUC_09895 [Promethearchaeota archaeon]
MDFRERVTPRSIGFSNRQHEFFDFYPDFDVSKVCREAIDNQIRIINPSFLKREEENEETTI